MYIYISNVYIYKCDIYILTIRLSYIIYIMLIRSAILTILVNAYSLSSFQSIVLRYIVLYYSIYSL